MHWSEIISLILLVNLQFGPGSVQKLSSSPCSVSWDILKPGLPCVSGLKLLEGSFTAYLVIDVGWYLGP